MAQLSQLVPSMDGVPEVRMSTMGHLLWICWQRTLPGAINQTLENYGGMQIYVKDDQRQAIWFFFTEDVFLVLARLIIWGNFNELAVSVELFPGRLQIDRKGDVSLLVDTSLQNQEIVVPDKLEVWVHPKSCEKHVLLPGIEFQEKRGRQGMTGITWFSPVVDVRMPFSSSQSWLMVIHPLGNPLDRAFIDGWYVMLKKINDLIQYHKIKFIVENNFLILALDNLLLLRNFVRDFLELVREMDAAGSSWPCVSAVVDRANLNFSADVPQKVNLHWARLVAGFPYISYRNAYLLGKGFLVRDLRFSSDRMTMDEWCNIQLNVSDNRAESMPLLMPSRLTEPLSEGITECFFCGLPTHETFECPTLKMARETENIWSSQAKDSMAKIDFDSINRAFQKIEKKLEAESTTALYNLVKERSNVSILLHAIFDICKYSQLRNVQHFWLYRMKEPDPNEKPARRDDNSIAWEVCDGLKKANNLNFSQATKHMQQLFDEHSRDGRMHTMAGFVAVGKKDYAQAITSFNRASVLTSNVPLQAWNEYLVARVEEVQGSYANAIQHYTKVARIMPDSLDCRYRAVVCRVKMGFVEQTLDEISALIDAQPAMFNRFLIDPGLERGRILILSTLYSKWNEVEKRANAEKEKISNLRADFEQWFDENHPFYHTFNPGLQDLELLCEIKNYVSFLEVIEQEPKLEAALNSQIEEEIEGLREQYKAYLTALQNVRDEASWFPFPTALKEFGKDFNVAAGILNKAYSSNFKDVEVFHKAKKALTDLNALLRRLKHRLKSLRFVRDATLFTMTMGKTFFLLEIIGTGLAILLLLVIGMFGSSLGLEGLRALIAANKVSILEVTLVVITVVCLGISALRTTVVFDSRRDKLVEQAKTKREKGEQARLNRIRLEQHKKKELLRRQQEEEMQAELRRELRERMHEKDT
ncbi:MAG: hypothetical protein IJU76_13040 [Desulfovibrionaceae bacterium]|nr:hypothetical protein [Desulfovibrionaceae bacterium]